MKKIIISLLLLTPFLAGCTNIDSQLTLNDDKSASIVTSLAYEGNLLNQADKVAQTVTNNYEKFLDPIYNVETVYSDKLSTITATKSVKNVQHVDLDLSSLGFKSNLPDGKFVDVKKNFLVTSFNIDLTYDYPAQVSKIQKVEQKVDAAKGTKGLQPEYLQKYGDASEIQPADVDAREDFSEHLDPSAKVLIKEDDADADCGGSRLRERHLAARHAEIGCALHPQRNQAISNRKTTIIISVAKVPSVADSVWTPQARQSM